MNDSNEAENNYDFAKDSTWGPWLFRGFMVLSLVFAWWLVIYDHGVVSQH